MGSQNEMDFGGLDLVVRSVKTGANSAGSSGTALPSAETTVQTTGAQTVAGLKTFSDSIKIKQDVSDVHDTTPTAASLTSAFGAPATLGRGFVATIDDADGDTNGYLVWTSDASWYWLKGTKAA